MPVNLGPDLHRTAFNGTTDAQVLCDLGAVNGRPLIPKFFKYSRIDNMGEFGIFADRFQDL